MANVIAAIAAVFITYEGVFASAKQIILPHHSFPPGTFALNRTSACPRGHERDPS